MCVADARSEGSRVSHYVLQKSGSQFIMGSQQFSNVFQCIEFYKRHILDQVPLTTPIVSHVRACGRR